MMARLSHRINRHFLDLQDAMFEGLAEWLYGQGYITKAVQHDDRESAIENRVFARMKRCGCACCRLNLPELLEADSYDHRERFEGYVIAAAHYDEGAAYVRGASTQIEAGRVLVFAAQRSSGTDGGVA